MEAQAQTHHQYMARAVSPGSLDYEQHSPFGTDLSGTVDIPNKIPRRRCVFGSLNASLCQ